ncbi:MAG: ATP--guanido phosphotransferase [Lachnospiraceae bacterium]|nr:ATP--guanido phosphotransferase [Lachnospiraceae bacterium]MDO5551453.1 ATP--guanido phosphotransferase [Lachnospiraceae bacterium]
MLKWFEQMEGHQPNIVSSRVRLVRNWDQYRFPKSLSAAESEELVKRLEYGLKDLKELDGREYEYAYLEELDELSRRALRERRILNSSILEKKDTVGLIVSGDESVSVVLNGDDHIRMQLLSPGLHLDELWKRADAMDDYINARFSYAFDEKYGYLTSFPTNVGTGMRASVTLHLPTLSMGKKFQNLVADMSRFGVTLRGVYGEGSENYGALYEVANQKTLGLSEKEIIDLVAQTAGQLNSQEHQVRTLALNNHRLEREDEAYKSYGVLKYARRLSGKDAMIFLSQMMAGADDGILTFREPCSIYRLMLGIQTANLQKLSHKPLSKEELDVARAAYLREELPELA